MKIQCAGAEIYRNAQQKLEKAADKLVKDPGNPEELVKVVSAEDEAKVGAKLIEVGKRMTDTLLDVLA